VILQVLLISTNCVEVIKKSCAEKFKVELDEEVEVEEEVDDIFHTKHLDRKIFQKKKDF
jgi:hypothetical protein